MNSIERNEKFDDLYITHKDTVFRTCLMFLKDYQLAEDAAQETFYKVYCKLHTFRSKSDIKTWIIKICVNTCKDKLKKRSSKEQVCDEVIANLPAEFTDLESKLTVVNAIASLSLELRSAVILFYYNECTQKEIAEILKIPQTTVAYRIKTAKKQLKDIIGEV